MNKQEFLNELEKYLITLPKNDVSSHILFYGEMIDDIVEDGKTEEEAVMQIGTPKEVANQIIKETPLYKFAKEKVNKVAKTNRSALEIALIIVGLIAALQRIFLYAAVVIIVLADLLLTLLAAVGVLLAILGVLVVASIAVLVMILVLANEHRHGGFL